ncbi:hypothetical protein ACOME3_004460 [Neoechinorhynchus agilis]
MITCTGLSRLVPFKLLNFNSLRFSFRLLSKLAPTKFPEWKRGVVIFPQKTSVEDLRKNFRPSKDGGFYYDHRLIVREYPERYTIDELDTRRTGGADPDTGRKLFPRIGGGVKKTWLWVDLKRLGPKYGEPLMQSFWDILF